MKTLLLICVAFMLTGCVAIPVYDYGYYYPDYGPYPYVHVRPDINLFLGFHGGHVFRGGGHGGGRGGGGRR